MHTIGLVLATFFTFSGLAYLGVTLVLMIRFCQKTWRPLPKQAESFHRDISVLIPVKSPAPGLVPIIQSLLQQNYSGEIEICLIFQDSPCPEQAQVEKMQQSLPSKRKFRILEKPPFVGLNPKNSNLIQGFRVAAHDWIYVCDADTRPALDFFSRAMHEVQNDPMKYATAMSFHTDSADFGSHLETSGINLQMASYFLILEMQSRKSPKAFLNGASMLIHRTLIEKMGGIEIIANTLTDDIVIAQSLIKVGGRGKLIPTFALVSLTSESLGAFWRRFQRWIMIIKYFEPTVFWLAPTSWQWVHLLWIGAIFGLPICFTLSAFILLCRVFTVLAFSWMVTGQMADFLPALFLPLFDLLAPALWASCLCKKSVVWAGQRLCISKEGRLYVPESAQKRVRFQ